MLIPCAQLDGDRRAGFADNLSKGLARSYKRDESCIVVSILPSCYMLSDACAHPIWILTISALDSQLDPKNSQGRVNDLTHIMNTWLRTGTNRSFIRFLPLGDANLAQGFTTMRTQIEALEEKEAPKDSSSAGGAAGALRRVFNRSRPVPQSNLPKDEGQAQPQTSPKPPVKFGAYSDDSVKSPAPLNKNENTTRWPTPPPRHEIQVAQDENQQPRVKFDAKDSPDSRSSSTKAINEGARPKEAKKKKSLFNLFKSK